MIDDRAFRDPFEQARALQSAGQWAGASAAYSEALRNDPASVHALHGLARCQEMLGDIPAATQSFGALVRSDLRYEDGLSDAADFFERRGDLDKAEGILRIVVGLNPKSAVALQRLGLVSLDLGHNDEAVKLLRQGFDADQRDPDLRANLAIGLARSGSAEAARQLLRQGLLLAPDQPALLGNLGVLAGLQGDWEEAISLYDQALRIDPERDILRLNRAEALRSLSKNTEAERDYLDYLALHPGDPIALRGLVEIRGE